MVVASRLLPSTREVESIYNSPNKREDEVPTEVKVYQLINVTDFKVSTVKTNHKRTVFRSNVRYWTPRKPDSVHYVLVPPLTHWNPCRRLPSGGSRF